MPLEKVCGKLYIREVYKSEVYSEVKEVELCRIWKRKQRCNYPLTRRRFIMVDYKEVAERLQTDYHVVLPILDGHAGCDKQFTTIENNALDIIEFVNSKLGGSVLMMGGLSLGGQILLEILSQRKDICKFRKLDAK